MRFIFRIFFVDLHLHRSQYSLEWVGLVEHVHLMRLSVGLAAVVLLPGYYYSKTLSL